jgi:hypothetical protein
MPLTGFTEASSNFGCIAGGAYKSAVLHTTRNSTIRAAIADSANNRIFIIFLFFIVIF